LEHFSGRFRAAVTHLQSLTTGLCPGTRQFTYFRRLSILIVYLLVSVIIPKSGPSCAQTYCNLDVFSNARWLFDNSQLSKQSVSVTLKSL
jgi:hypothetical protein